MTFSVHPIDEFEAWLALDNDPAFAAGTPEYRCEGLRQWRMISSVATLYATAGGGVGGSPEGVTAIS